MGGVGGKGRTLLRVVALACLVAALFPRWTSTPIAAGERIEVRLGLGFSPLFDWHRETTESAQRSTVELEDGQRVVMTGYTSSKWGFKFHFMSVSAALLLAVPILFLITRRPRAPAPVP
jgi:hypothetical protein